ncbi:MAG: hypothetical protein D6714_16200 [Bacteroidetes bacterium]|nr:MAG: hypothetical protein D6714_16200 [Bacteroidota bacterium]
MFYILNIRQGVDWGLFGEKYTHFCAGAASSPAFGFRFFVRWSRWKKVFSGQYSVFSIQCSVFSAQSRSTYRTIHFSLKKHVPHV